MRQVDKSIVRNYIAQFFGMGVVFFSQVFFVPYFISFWGVDKYADWIVITALSSFFTMSNLGLNQASNNEFSFYYQKKDYDYCKRLVNNSFVFIIYVSLIVLACASCVAMVFGYKSLLGVKVFSEFETNFIFVSLLTNVFIKMCSGIYAGFYRVVSKAYINSYIDSTVLLTEIIILIIGLRLGANIINLLIIYNLPSILGFLFRKNQTRNWMSFKTNLSLKFEWVIFKKLIKPSFAFMFLPLGYSLNSQGMVFIVRSLLGSDSLVSFTTIRTLVNLLRTTVNVLSNSAYPEISNAYGKGDIFLIKSIFKRTIILSLVVTSVIVFLLIVFGKDIYFLWTKKQVFFDSSFFNGMLVVLVISVLWNAISTLLLATNKHSGFTLLFLLVQILSLSLSYIVLSTFDELSLISLVLLISELILLIYSLVNVRRFFKNKI